jgi:hypothetical protein
MKYINPRPYVEGNLTEIPAGLSYTEMKKRFSGNYNRVRFADMNKTTYHSRKFSQRMFAEYLHDVFGNTPLAMEIYVAGQHKWTFKGGKEMLRHLGYSKAMALGAILNRRGGLKTNKDCTFRIR